MPSAFHSTQPTNGFSPTADASAHTALSNGSHAAAGGDRTTGLIQSVKRLLARGHHSDVGDPGSTPSEAAGTKPCGRSRMCQASDPLSGGAASPTPPTAAPGGAAHPAGSLSRHLMRLAGGRAASGRARSFTHLPHFLELTDAAGGAQRSAASQARVQPGAEQAPGCGEAVVAAQSSTAAGAKAISWPPLNGMRLWHITKQAHTAAQTASPTAHRQPEPAQDRPDGCMPSTPAAVRQREAPQAVQSAALSLCPATTGEPQAAPTSLLQPSPLPQQPPPLPPPPPPPQQPRQARPHQPHLAPPSSAQLLCLIQPPKSGSPPAPQPTAPDKAAAEARPCGAIPGAPTAACAPLPQVQGAAPGPPPSAAAAPTKGAARARQPAHAARLLRSVCAAAPPPMRRPVWRLADYALQARLYKGAAGGVYQALCLHSGAHVALKVSFLDKVHEYVIQRLFREIRIHAGLQHEHILELYGAFQDAGRLVLVLEHAPRGDLYGLVRRLPGRRLAEEQAQCCVLAPLLSALADCHGRGLAHRDIKPENLLLSGSWRLLLADWGAAIDTCRERAVTRTGTAHYMAPEVLRCPLKSTPEDNKDDASLAYSTAADIWSVGVLAFELLMGFPPGTAPPPAAAAHTPATVAAAAAAAANDALSQARMAFPALMTPGAYDFISSALAHSPADRPTASTLLAHPWLKHAVRQMRQEGEERQRARAAWEAEEAAAQGRQAHAGGDDEDEECEDPL